MGERQGRRSTWLISSTSLLYSTPTNQQARLFLGQPSSRGGGQSMIYIRGGHREPTRYFAFTASYEWLGLDRSLSSLPNLLIIHIASYLSQPNLNSLTQTNHHLYDLLLSHLYANDIRNQSYSALHRHCKPSVGSSRPSTP
jgi:hypothetical protein